MDMHVVHNVIRLLSRYHTRDACSMHTIVKCSLHAGCMQIVIKRLVCQQLYTPFGISAKPAFAPPITPINAVSL